MASSLTNRCAIFKEIEARITRFDARLLVALESEFNTLAMVLIKIGTDMDVVGSAERLASWIGNCPSKTDSADMHKSGRVRKGSLYVRPLLCEFAQVASRTTSVFRSKLQALVIRRDCKRHLLRAQAARTLPGFRRQP